MLKYLLIFSLILISNIPISLCDQPEPVVSLNEYLNRTQLLELDNGVFISQFFLYMLTGRYDGQSSDDTSLDNLTINDLLDVGFNQVALPILAEQLYDEDFKELYRYANDIIRRLNENGTSSVKYKEIKPLFSNLVYISNEFL